jgi:hypothetical protein
MFRLSVNKKHHNMLMRSTSVQKFLKNDSNTQIQGLNKVFLLKLHFLNLQKIK